MFQTFLYVHKNMIWRSFALGRKKKQSGQKEISAGITAQEKDWCLNHTWWIASIRFLHM